ncbi:M48 family metallopeptidase [Hellea balneolensis]|uniref:M48 family metallopeptidase n=1 Tax=Hellea balneolensis TaxID=287478 RepID=UPI0004111B28|nr:M48 family metallopeptidase [Hellea balneolensis]
MMKAYGLKTHIWNNNLRSVVLLILFPVLLLFMAFGLILLWTAISSDMNTEQGLVYALNTMPSAAPIALGAAGGWFAIAFMGHQAMIDMATKSKSVTISQEPRAYRLLENLSISRGETTPKLKIIETPAMNAFASGIRDKNYTVTLTRGLMQNLDDEELEAVIAHELSHIRNRDVRLLIIAVIFVGIFAFVGEGLVRSVFRTNLARNDHHRRSGGGNAGALIFFAIAIIGVSYLLAMLTRFALSRKREFMADAGAVELTKNPDAMIRALQKISGRAELHNVPAEIKEMAFENARTGFAGMFATHPPIEKRIEALVKFAGGQTGTNTRPQKRSGVSSQNTSKRENRPPFGRRGPWTR